MPSIRIVFVERVDSRPNSRSAVSQPMTATGGAAVHFGRAHQPAALGVEVGEVDVLAGDALHGDLIELGVAIRHRAAASGLAHHRRDERAERADRVGLVHRA